MIPLVDIVFTLLIIFMILAPMIHKGIEVQVPESEVGETVSEENQHIVTITAEGAIWFDDQQLALEELQGYIRTIPAEEIVYVQGDTAVPYGTVMNVISEMKAAGLQNVGLITKPQHNNNRQ